LKESFINAKTQRGKGAKDFLGLQFPCRAGVAHDGSLATTILSAQHHASTGSAGILAGCAETICRLEAGAPSGAAPVAVKKLH
jgi:hypothetical protein